SVITAADYGAIGRNLNFIARVLLGTYSFIIPLIGLYISIYIMIKHRWPQRRLTPRMLGVSLLALVVITFNHYHTFQILRAEGPVHSILDTTWKMVFNERSSGIPRDVGSGMMGAFFYALMGLLFDDVGTIVILIACFLVGLLLLTGFSYADLVGHMSKFDLKGERLRELWTDYRQK